MTIRLWSPSVLCANIRRKLVQRKSLSGLRNTNLKPFDRKNLLDNVKDASQLSQCLTDLPPTKRSNCMAALIIRATTAPSNKGLLMSLPEPTVLDILEETRDVCSLPPYAQSQRS